MRKNTKGITSVFECRQLNWEIVKFLDAKDVCFFKVNKKIAEDISSFLMNPAGNLINIALCDAALQFERKIMSRRKNKNKPEPLLTFRPPQSQHFSFYDRVKSLGEDSFLLLFISLIFIIPGIILIKATTGGDSAGSKKFFYGLGGSFLTAGSFAGAYTLYEARKGWHSWTRISELQARRSIYENRKRHLIQLPLQDSSGNEENSNTTESGSFRNQKRLHFNPISI